MLGKQVAGSPPTTRAVSKAERLTRLRQARGVNWFPSWARSPVDYWGANMPHDTAARELRFVAGLGFDHVRVWLSAWGYEQDPARYISNLRSLLDCAGRLGLGVVMELFDSCGSEPTAGSERVVRVEELASLSAGSPSLAAIRAMAGDRLRDVLGYPGLVEVPWRGDATVAIFEGFVPNPGYPFLKAEYWPRWDAFTEAVVRCVHDHPAMLLLEVMNEPFVTQLGQQVDYEPIVAFYRHAAEVARAAGPRLPLAIGAEQSNMLTHYDNLPDLDVVSFHSLNGPDALRGAIALAQEIAAGRPVYLSEWGYFPGGRDEDQLAEVRALLPIVTAARIGWAITHLVAGYGPFATTALLFPSGVMRPAAAYLREQLASPAALLKE